MQNKKQRIAVFGGTFNPPHNGHSLLAEKIIEQQIADKILFVPALRPPHKPGIPSVSFSNRSLMVEMMVKNMNRRINGEPPYSVSRIEGEWSDTPSYTYNTMNELERRHPDNEFLLLVGGDSLLNLHTWYKSEGLVSRWKILTYPRGKTFSSPEKVYEELKRNWPENITSLLFQSILPFDVCNISSTKIRKELRNKINIVYSIDSAVYKFIKEKGFYHDDKQNSKNS